MDLHDREFDYRIRSQINAEIPVSKYQRHSAWDSLQLAIAQPPTITPANRDDDFALISAPLAVFEPYHARILRWLGYIVTYESAYQKAHASSIQYFKSHPHLSGGMSLHGLEFMRQRWTVAV